ncbi:MAG: hypothetical protein LBJ01_04690, partial [Tannerella sp.]|nr:hypothetical protein [Tannerella sp.]
AEEYETKKRILVSNDPLPRIVDNILILPWKVFLERLWAGGYYLTHVTHPLHRTPAKRHARRALFS